MTEEKENCNFQQNYNVFGLDDKPCCYLYHKYCDEIDNCYFKRCKCLEQENKSYKQQHNDDTEEIAKLGLDVAILEQENKELYENGQIEITKLCNEKTKYRSALEEIRILATKNVSIENFVKIQNKINEVLNEGK